MTGQNIFSKVSTQAERERLFVSLEISNTDIIVFDEKLERSIFSFEYLNGETVAARLGVGNHDKLLSSKNITLLLDLDRERYFIKTSIQSLPPQHQKRFALDFSRDIYRLQRREFFRISIPEDTKIKIDVFAINNRKVKVKSCLTDLSGGGFACVLKDSDIGTIEPGDILRGSLWLSKENNLKVEAKLCYRNGKTGLSGFAFLELPSRNEQYITALVLDIHRRILAKEKKYLRK